MKVDHSSVLVMHKFFPSAPPLQLFFVHCSMTSAVPAPPSTSSVSSFKTTVFIQATWKIRFVNCLFLYNLSKVYLTTLSKRETNVFVTHAFCKFWFDSSFRRERISMLCNFLMKICATCLVLYTVSYFFTNLERWIMIIRILSYNSKSKFITVYKKFAVFFQKLVIWVKWLGLAQYPLITAKC